MIIILVTVLVGVIVHHHIVLRVVRNTTSSKDTHFSHPAISLGHGPQSPPILINHFDEDLYDAGTLCHLSAKKTSKQDGPEYAMATPAQSIARLSQNQNSLSGEEPTYARASNHLHVSAPTALNLSAGAEHQSPCKSQLDMIQQGIDSDEEEAYRMASPLLSPTSPHQGWVGVEDIALSKPAPVYDSSISLAHRAASVARVSVEKAAQAQAVLDLQQANVKMQSALGSESGRHSRLGGDVSDAETESLRLAILQDMEVLHSDNPQSDYLQAGDGEYSMTSDNWVLEQEWILDNAGRRLSTPRSSGQSSANHESAIERAKETVKQFSRSIPAEGCPLSPNQIHDDASQIADPQEVSAFVRSPTTDSGRSIRPCLS